MNPIESHVRIRSREISHLTSRLGRRVEVSQLGVIDRSGELPLGPTGGLVSPNGACRLFRAADGWMALNLARKEDGELVSAWLECEFGGDAWDLVEAHAHDQACNTLRDRAVLLGLPACRVDEVDSAEPERLHIRHPGFRRATPRANPKVVDLSALWAGPMCGAILAAMGAEVTRVESIRRPDPTRISTPVFYRRLNGAKAELALDVTTAADQARLRAMVLDADVVITSARRRGLASIGLDPDTLIAARPGLVWVAITGYGLGGGPADPWAVRVAFGDDAAAAGGLLGWTATGEPRFLGDALSDPVTGLDAAIGALRGLEHGGGVVVDAAMALCAARAAATCAVALPE